MIQDEVRTFIVNNFYVTDLGLLKDSESLLDSGVIDSTGVLEVIAFIESTYELTVKDEEMLPENLDSIEHITQFVIRKKQ